MRLLLLWWLGLCTVFAAVSAEKDVTEPLLERLVSRRHRRQAVVSVWTAWSQWTTCSVSCGGGVRTRTRDCVGRGTAGLVRLNTPSCDGDHVEHYVCEQRPCRWHALPAREYQCKQKNHEKVFGHHYTWRPFSSVGGSACRLTCLAAGYSFYYNFGDVTDGTPCGRDGDVCVQGHCQRVGCDGRVGSPAMLDRCRICDGMNVNCTRHHGAFTTKNPHKHYGYTRVITLPKGSTYVEIHDKSNNYLALKDSSGFYIINGRFTIDPSGTYWFAGTTIQYNRTKYKESIEIEGPTQQDLHLMVIFRFKNPGISYKFYLPTDMRDYINEPSPLTAYNPRLAFVPTPAPKALPTTERPPPPQRPDADYDKREDNVIPELNYAEHLYESNRPGFDPLPKPIYDKILGKKKIDLTKNIFGKLYNQKHKETSGRRLENRILEDAQTYDPSKEYPREVDDIDYDANYDSVKALYDKAIWEDTNGISPNRRQLRKPKPYKARFSNKEFFKTVFGEDNDGDGEGDVYNEEEKEREQGSYNVPVQDMYGYDLTARMRNEKDANTDETEKDEPVLNGRYYGESQPNGRLVDVDPDEESETYYTNMRGEETSYFDGNQNVYGYNETESNLRKPSREHKHHTRHQSVEHLPDPLPTEQIRQTGGQNQESCPACHVGGTLGTEYCSSDFAVHAEILSAVQVNNETRYEMKVRQAYRSTFSLLSLEFLWNPSLCPCPDMQVGVEYIIVGNIVHHRGRRETRLQVENNDHVEEYSPLAEARVKATSEVAGCDFL